MEKFLKVLMWIVLAPILLFLWCLFDVTMGELSGSGSSKGRSNNNDNDII